MKLTDGLFRYPAFQNQKDHINIWLVAALSEESGTDIPYKKIVKDTLYDTSLGGHCIKRLPVIRRSLLAMQMASLVPFEQLIVIINSELDGGTGGATIVMTLSPDFVETVVHEIGHSLAGLEDQYYYGSSRFRVGKF
jgi:hypothetical protein